jgi:hypothetical protein
MTFAELVVVAAGVYLQPRSVMGKLHDKPITIMSRS